MEHLTPSTNLEKRRVKVESEIILVMNGYGRGMSKLCGEGEIPTWSRTAERCLAM